MSGILSKIETLIYAQYAQQADLSLYQVYHRFPEDVSVSSELLDFACTERDALLQVLHAEIAKRSRRIIPLFLRLTKEFAYRNNQFIHYSPQDEAILNAIYLRFMQDLHALIAHSRSSEELEAQFRQVLSRHHRALQAFTAQFLKGMSPQAPESHTFFQHTVCEEYSEALQLELMGITLEDLQEPILDIGCGTHGRLVHFLRSHGLEAFGIDRVCSMPSPVLWADDWLQFHFQPTHWGTLLSHLGFSHHFLFHHLYQYGQPAQYAVQYMAMLNALKPGGDFYYAPGLPFIEAFLPRSQYRVMTRPIPVVVPTQVGQIFSDLNQEIQAAICSATHIKKLA